MRYSFAALADIIAALAIASAIVSVPGFASAETLYRWRDGAGRWHFSNQSERVPAGAEVAKLPELNIVKQAPFSQGPISFIASAPVGGGRSFAPPVRSSGCGAADPSPLIDVITTRLESMQMDRSELTLLVAGMPVWYSSDAYVQALPATETDGAPASEQAAVAYPAVGACPRTPPLERYAAMAPPSSSFSPGLCADYQRAAAEIDMALSRNRNVERPFQYAAARRASLTETGTPGQNVCNPPWLVEAGAVQTAELATEIDQFVQELAVAREEIERAARAQRCW